jgi:hypothetical protein
LTSTGLREEGKGTAVIKLCVGDETNLGIVLAGSGLDKEGAVACIAGLAPESIALRSDALEPGDIILCVNGTPTAGLNRTELISLLEPRSRSIVQLEIEYELPAPLQNLTPSIAKCSRLVIERTSASVGSFGFTLRGGVCAEFGLCRPLTVTQVRPGSAADSVQGWQTEGRRSHPGN